MVTSGHLPVLPKAAEVKPRQRAPGAGRRAGVGRRVQRRVRRGDPERPAAPGQRGRRLRGAHVLLLAVLYKIMYIINNILLIIYLMMLKFIS